MHDIPQPSSPALALPAREYYQIVHTLTGLLPAPLADTPEALLIRNHAAIAKIAAMLPVNLDEADLAAQCVAARAQAEEVMRSIRTHTGDLKSGMQMNAQYNALVRTSLAAHSHLLRTQAVRHKREANNDTLNADAWTQHVAAGSMRQALEAPLPAAVPPAAAHAPGVPYPGQDPFTALPPLVEEQVAAASAWAPAAPAGAMPQPDMLQPAMPQPDMPPPAAMPPATPQPAVPPPATYLPTMPQLSAPQPDMTWPATPQPAMPRPAAATQATPKTNRSRRRPARVEPEDPPRDLDAEADYYALVYPRRAREIRRFRGLPPDCSFGPPDHDLVQAIIAGTSPALRAVDETAGALV